MRTAIHYRKVAALSSVVGSVTAGQKRTDTGHNEIAGSTKRVVSSDQKKSREVLLNRMSLRITLGVRKFFVLANTRYDRFFSLISVGTQGADGGPSARGSPLDNMLVS
jgi:hypothetical protein